MIGTNELSILITWLSFVVLHPIITWIFSSKKTNWGRYAYVFITMLVITGIIAGFLIMQPERFATFVGTLTNSSI